MTWTALQSSHVVGAVGVVGAVRIMLRRCFLPSRTLSKSQHTITENTGPGRTVNHRTAQYHG